MTGSEIAQLASDGVEIGGHTVDHTALGTLAPAEQRTQIVQDKENLERITGRPLTCFAYPFGSAGDFNDVSARVAREAGYKLGCANIPGTVTQRTNRFSVPREIVRDWNAAEFASRVHNWLGPA
jgi:peptidoglycan/xylan/chitin deacetylase (PgdA/CDA1 family)